MSGSYQHNGSYEGPSGGGGGGDLWSDPVDANIVPDISGSRFIGGDSFRFDTIYSIDFDASGEVLIDGSLGIGTNTPSVNLDVIGMSRFNHTATFNDDVGVEIGIDAAGFGDIKALDINYATGSIDVSNEEAAILINVNESTSTGGEVFGLEVVTTDFGNADVYGLKTGVGVSPIGQLSGLFVDADSILVNAVDQLTALSAGGAGNVSVFSADNDTITIGSAAKFEEIEFLIDTPASGGGIDPVFEFSTGVGTWSTFTPIDGTNGFRSTGVVLYDDATIPTWAVGTGSEFLIRITRTRNSLSTTPILDQLEISQATLFEWDESGNLNINNLTVNGTVTANGDDWHTVGGAGEPAFQNSWTSAAGLKFRIFNGFLVIQGSVQSGTSTSATIFTLPAEYLLGENAFFAAYSDAGVARVRVRANGNINITSGGSTTDTTIDVVTPI